MREQFTFQNGKGETFSATLVIPDAKELALELARRAHLRGASHSSALHGTVMVELTKVG